jgi:hypothetical protein
LIFHVIAIFRELDVTLDKTSAKAMSSLMKLQNLEGFLYGLRFKSHVTSKQRDKIRRDIFVQCFENLPKLKICMWNSGTHDSSELIQLFQKILKKHEDDDFKLNVEELVLTAPLNFPAKKVPMIKEVHTKGNFSCANDIATFSKLTVLEMEDVSSRTVYAILRKLGKQMKSLTIGNEYMNTVSIFL